MSHVLPCGCELRPKEVFYEEMNMDCPLVWSLFATGHTKGVFQLEKKLGQDWSRRARPASIDHVAALVSILRPGTLNAFDDEGVNMTEHFCRRKNGEEPVLSYHPLVDNILKATFGIIIYQEQLIAISAQVCGFDELEQRRIQKAVSKKVQEEIAAVGKMFIAKGKEKGLVPAPLVDTLWEIIKASGRYLFPKAHAYSYALGAYRSAYIKAHFPLEFYTEWLGTSHHKPDPHEEMAELVQDARLFDVDVIPPTVLSDEPHFYNDGKKVYFGLCDIRGIGESGLGDIKAARALAREKMSDWMTALFNFLSRLSISTSSALVKAGAMREFVSGRKRALAELEVLFQKPALTDREIDFARSIINEVKDVPSMLERLALPKKEGGLAVGQRREILKGKASVLRSPPHSLDDGPAWLVRQEEDTLGVALTCSNTDACDQSEVTATALQVLKSKKGVFTLLLEVVEVRPHRDKNGNDMSFVKAKDGTATLDMALFSEQHKKVVDVLYEGALLLAVVSVNMYKGKKSFSLERARLAQKDMEEK